MSNLPATLPVVRTGQELIEKVHAVFKSDEFNVLIPKSLNINPKVEVVINIIEFDTNPKFKENKDFWSMDNQEAILSARAIRKLATAANIRYTPSETGVDGEPVYDKDGQILRLRFKAVCHTIDALGMIAEGSGHYEYNYDVDLNDKSLTPFQVNQRRRFALQLAETGAKKRAFFDCLGYVNTSYSKKDFAKPFVVPCVRDVVDYNDPAIKQLIAQRAIGAQDDVYGKDDRQPIKAEAEVVKTETNPNEAQQPAQAATAPPPEAPPAETQSPQDKRAAYRADWQDDTSNNRAKEIRKLAAQVQHDITKTAKGAAQTPPEQWDENTQLTWLMWLATKAGIIPGE
jgi:hypothetical protein